MGHTSGFTTITRCPRWGHHGPRCGCNGQSAGRRVGRSGRSGSGSAVPVPVRFRSGPVRSVGRSAVGRSVCSGWVGGWMGVGWVGWSVGQSVRMASQSCHMLASRSVAPVRLVGPVGHRMALRPQHFGAAPRASLERSRSEVWHTSGFTAATGCPRWGHSCEARGVPHPLPSAGVPPSRLRGYRTPHTIRSHRKPSEATEAIGSHWKQSEAIRSHRKQSEAIGSNRKPSVSALPRTRPPLPFPPDPVVRYSYKAARGLPSTTGH